jgi:glutamate-1-semialdehyde 2,1-aminomutase
MSTASEVNSTWQNRAELSIAHGALTNSKRPECLVKGVYPTHLTRAQGAWVWDASGKSYIDFICGLGSSILGHGHVEVAGEVSRRAFSGPSFSLGTTLEVETAEKVKELFPFIDLVRFLKTGTDACTAALRIARTYRKKGMVLTEGYHGWSDEFVSLTPPAHGVYSEHMIDRLETITQIDHDTAAVIIEPIMTDAGSDRIRFLHALRDQCDKTGALLIFDEVITGFRHPKFSASRHYGVTPDLICLGKAMGNGMPISVVGGKREIMNSGEYFVSSTFAGETLSLAAALKTMTLLQTKYDLSYLWGRGDYFQRRFNELYPAGLKIEGYPTRGVFKGDAMVKALFFQEACRAGLLFGPSFFFNFSHIDHTEMVLNTCQDILVRIKTGSVSLLGEMPKTPFAQQLREKTA